MRSSADRKGDDLQQKSNGDWSITLPLFILRSHANTTRESNARILAQTSRLAMTRFLLPTNRSSFYFHLSTSPSLTCATQLLCFLSGLNNNILLGTMYSSTPMYSVLEQKKEKGKMENGKWKIKFLIGRGAPLFLSPMYGVVCYKRRYAEGGSCTHSRPNKYTKTKYGKERKRRKR